MRIDTKERKINFCFTYLLSPKQNRFEESLEHLRLFP
jgi:hypothetical protein